MVNEILIVLTLLKIESFLGNSNVDCRERIRGLYRHSVYGLILPHHSRSVTGMSHLGKLASVFVSCDFRGQTSMLIRPLHVSLHYIGKFNCSGIIDLVKITMVLTHLTRNRCSSTNYYVT
jgi:hypothetical protein